MPRPDPYEGTRMGSIDNYAEEKKRYNEKAEMHIFKVYDSKLGGYKYILCTKSGKYLKYFYFWYKWKLYGTKRPGLYSAYNEERVNTDLLKAHDVTKTMKGRIIYTMFKLRFWW